MNLDIGMDIRDIVYDVQHLDSEDVEISDIALSAVGLIPIIGVIKPAKKFLDAADAVTTMAKVADDAADVAKAADIASDVSKVAEVVSDASKAAEVADDVVDVAKTADKFDNAADVVSNVGKLAESADDVSKTVEVVSDSGKMVESVNDAGKVVGIANNTDDAVESVNEANKVLEATSDIPNGSNDIVEESKRVVSNVTDSNVSAEKIVVGNDDIIEDVSDTSKNADTIIDFWLNKGKKGGSYKDVKLDSNGKYTEVHEIPSFSSTGAEIRADGPAVKISVEDHKLTASYGSSIDAREYRKLQKEYIEAGDYQAAIQMDIDDLQSKFGDKYDEAIKEMLVYAETIGWWSNGK